MTNDPAVISRAEFEAFKQKTTAVLDAQSHLLEVIISELQSIRDDHVNGVKSFQEFLNSKFDELKKFKPVHP